MDQSDTDAVFAGSIPELYDTLLVPLIFAPYATDLAARAAALGPTHVLETAAGTGVLTRALATALPADAEIVATDLNPPMLARAAAVGASRPVTWQQADARQLPFDDARFDLVTCQFGVMFFPDKAKAFAEARRVLRPGGTFLFSVWDRIGENVFADVVTRALARQFPANPPAFFARTPHGYHDLATIASDLARGGFARAPAHTTVSTRSRAPAARDVAIAYCQGTPLRGELEALGPDALSRATIASERALTEAFGDGPIEGKIQAHVIRAQV